MESGELGGDLFALLVELDEPFGDPRAHGGRCGVGGVGRELFEAEDLGVLRGVDLLEPGSQGGGLVVTVGGRVGGGEPGGEQLGLLGAEDVLGEEQADDLVQPPLRAFDRAGMIRVAGGVGGTGRVRGHS